MDIKNGLDNLADWILFRLPAHPGCGTSNSGAVMFCASVHIESLSYRIFVYQMASGRVVKNAVR